MLRCLRQEFAQTVSPPLPTHIHVVSHLQLTHTVHIFCTPHPLLLLRTCIHLHTPILSTYPLLRLQSTLCTHRSSFSSFFSFSSRAYTEHNFVLPLLPLCTCIHLHTPAYFSHIFCLCPQLTYLLTYSLRILTLLLLRHPHIPTCPYSLFLFFLCNPFAFGFVAVSALDSAPCSGSWPSYTHTYMYMQFVEC